MTPSRSGAVERSNTEAIGLKSELEFLRTLAEILAPLDGGPADVRRALDAIGTMQLALSGTPRSEKQQTRDSVLDEPAKLLLKAAALLEEHGWCQSALVKGGRMCAVAALRGWCKCRQTSWRNPDTRLWKWINY